MDRRFQNDGSINLVSERIKGVVKKWNEVKGYGFITREDGQGEVFVHRNDIEGRNRNRFLIKGQIVVFTIVSGSRGLKATEVVKKTLLGRKHSKRTGVMR